MQNVPKNRNEVTYNRKNQFTKIAERRIEPSLGMDTDLSASLKVETSSRWSLKALASGALKASVLVRSSCL